MLSLKELGIRKYYECISCGHTSIQNTIICQICGEEIVPVEYRIKEELKNETENKER